CRPAAAAMAGWAPTHVRVTALRARGLRAKAAAGGSDAYAVMALGRDKFRTSVAERCRGEPEWREEATFELPARPAPLRLTVLHRALAGADKFLGRAELELEALREDGGRRHTRWYKLRSKPGKKEKERGEIEVDIQFMRSNMTASMFDLSMKDKPRSPFGKLKDKLKGKRSSGFSDTASAIVPSTSHSPADSEDEEAEKEKKKSKFKALFSKPGLQKTSLSQSMSVLPTQQPLTQRVRLRPSDFQPQWDEEESETSPASEQKPAPSPLFKSRKPAFLDSRQLTQGTTNHTKKDGLSLFSGLKSKSDPVSKSSLCINGSHVYMEESTTKDKTPASSPSPHNLRKKQLFASEENLSSRPTKPPEELGRASPGQVFSGSTSLETFKSMTLPSYKLLSSEEHLDTSVPPGVEALRETKKPDHKKSALLSLVTGKKDTVKSSDAEIVPDPQGEEKAIPEEKSEEEATCPEPPAALGRGSLSGDTHHFFVPFCRLGLSPEEEPKATLPTLAPDPLPAFLSEHHISANNPFISEVGQMAQVPASENIPSSPASPTSAFAAELWNDKNPFSPEWDGVSRALDPDSTACFPPSQHPAASLAQAPPPGQLPAGVSNPFAAGWGQAAEGSGTGPPWAASSPATPRVPSGCGFTGNNPFVSRGSPTQRAFLEAVAPAVAPRGTSKPLEKEGGDDLSVSVINVKPVLPVPGERGSLLAALPVIPEGGSDDEQLGDCQESSGLTAGVVGNGEQPQGLPPLHGEQRELSASSAAAPEAPAPPGGGGAAGAVPRAGQPGSLAVLPAAAGAPRVCVQEAASGFAVTSHSREKQELESSAGVERDFSEPSAFSSSLSSPCQPYSSSHSLLSDTPSRRAESPKEPAAEGSADKAGNSGKKKLLQARVSPSEPVPSPRPRGAESVSPKHRLHPVKPMSAMASKPQSKNLNVIGTMNEKLLEMSVKKYDPSEPAYAYAQLTHDELIQLVLKQKDALTRKDLQVRELEDYIDNLLVRVMEETPNILRVSLSGNRRAGKM
ncbi:RFIP1 protein, partial [Spelaeornis formosus]|nr:RFIP1 protein [Elachura formosa]